MCSQSKSQKYKSLYKSVLPKLFLFAHFWQRYKIKFLYFKYYKPLIIPESNSLYSTVLRSLRSKVSFVQLPSGVRDSTETELYFKCSNMIWSHGFTIILRSRLSLKVGQKSDFRRLHTLQA